MYGELSSRLSRQTAVLGPALDGLQSRTENVGLEILTSTQTHPQTGRKMITVLMILTTMMDTAGKEVHIVYHKDIICQREGSWPQSECCPGLSARPALCAI